MPGKLVLKIIISGFPLILSTVGNGQQNFSVPEKLQISSQAEESMPIFHDNGLYFVRSFHAGNTGGESAGQDIWRSEKQDGHWSDPHNRFPYFNDIHNNAVIGLSSNGAMIYMMNSYHRSEEKSVRILAAVKNGNDWTIPKTMTLPGINPEGKFSGFYMHPSEKILLISMEGKNTLGKEDLYVCLLNPVGRWSEPIHLGAIVNTPGYEISPFLDPGGTRLYFASNGRPDSRDADIYFTERTGHTWQEWSQPVKLPEGINSDYFDAYFSLTTDGDAYFVSARDGGLTDLYSSLAISQESEKQPEPVIAKFKNDTVKPGSKAPFRSKGAAFIYFDFASAELKPEMQDMLRYIASGLKDKNFRIELNGYADDMGSEEYNDKLSRERAERVKDFLVHEGLEANFIYPAGMGEVQIREDGNPSEFREKNRRVELAILE